MLQLDRAYIEKTYEYITRKLFHGAKEIEGEIICEGLYHIWCPNSGSAPGSKCLLVQGSTTPWATAVAVM